MLVLSCNEVVAHGVSDGEVVTQPLPAVEPVADSVATDVGLSVGVAHAEGVIPLCGLPLGAAVREGEDVAVTAGAVREGKNEALAGALKLARGVALAEGGSEGVAQPLGAPLEVTLSSALGVAGTLMVALPLPLPGAEALALKGALGEASVLPVATLLPLPGAVAEAAAVAVSCSEADDGIDALGVVEGEGKGVAVAVTSGVTEARKMVAVTEELPLSVESKDLLGVWLLIPEVEMENDAAALPEGASVPVPSDCEAVLVVLPPPIPAVALGSQPVALAPLVAVCGVL